MTQAAEGETRGIRLQQGVTVLVSSISEIKQAWKDFKRDDYEPDMDKVCVVVYRILHE